MLLATDLGNTSLKLAIFKEENRVAYNIFDAAQDDYGALIKNFLYRNNFNETSIDDVIISSVVPKLSQKLKDNLEGIFVNEPIFYDVDNPLGISVDTPNPKEVGSDLLVMCAYGHNKYPNDELFVLSLGTASVISHVNKEGVFEHCIISPGYGKLAQTLYGSAAKLPKFDFYQIQF